MTADCTLHQCSCNTAPIKDTACRDHGDGRYDIDHLRDERHSADATTIAARLATLRNDYISAALCLTTVAQAIEARQSRTRFLASDEAPINNEWKEAIAAAQSEDAVKIDVFNDIRPLPGTGGYGTVLRSLHTPFTDEWGSKREQAYQERERLLAEIVARVKAGRGHETLLTAGQTAGGIKKILPVATIMRQLISETEATLRPLNRLDACKDRYLVRSPENLRSGRCEYQIDHERPDHSTSTWNNLWAGNDAAPHRLMSSGMDFGILWLWLKALRINPDAGQPVSYDHCLA